MTQMKEFSNVYWNAEVSCPTCGQFSYVMFVKEGYEGGFCPNCGGQRTLRNCERQQVLHMSDCAVHNMPALPNELCNCGASERHGTK